MSIEGIRVGDDWWEVRITEVIYDFSIGPYIRVMLITICDDFTRTKITTLPRGNIDKSIDDDVCIGCNC